MIRCIQIADAPSICGIYNPYIRDTYITFEEQPVDEETMAGRIAAILPTLPWLVWQEHEQILGYAYAALWRERSAYRHSVESTIYLRPEAMGRGIGTQLYGALLEELRSRPVHAVIGCISLPNPASVTLHEKLGFARIGEFPEVGRKFDRWVDVGYWQLLL
jgi:phosphinothricin acetyltransferase